jgi:ABC-type branched-subunit amino acid transport system substrate-binding protein
MSNALQDFLTKLSDIRKAIKEHRYWDAFKIAPLLIFSLLACIVVVIAIVRLLYVYEWSSVPQPPPTSQRKILVIGPETGGEEDTWRYIRQGIEAAQKKLGTGELGDSVTVEFQNDRSDPQWAAQVARTVCSDPNYVLALGFVQSGVAEMALQQFTREDCQLPVILIATTSTELTRFNKEGKWSAPILRLPPSNFQQATQIVAALGDTFSTAQCRLLVVKDVDAAAYAYSKNLEEEFTFVRRMDKRIHCDVGTLDVIDFDEAKIQARLKERMAVQPPVDVVLFFGMTNRAVQLLQALTNLTTHDKRPVIIVSDGSTTTKLIDLAGSNAKCVWGAFPFGEAREFQAEMPDSYKHLPSYFAYGYDAYLIGLKSLQEAGKEPTRKVVGEQFKKLATEKQFISGMAGRYEFDSAGGLRFFLDKDNPNLVLGQYHLWQLREQQGKVVWDHRSWRDPLNVGCANQ